MQGQTYVQTDSHHGRGNTYLARSRVTPVCMFEYAFDVYVRTCTCLARYDTYAWGIIYVSPLSKRDV